MMHSDESKLSLQVFTPSVEKNAKKPVMVWIHGGGWSMGSAELYSGSVLSAYGDVVVVVISYRLGVPGFLFGNWGLFDQLEALKWVQSNIASYGGDPDKVTIFGASAGSWSVEALLCSKLSTGLFHRAIGQSGCLKANTFDKVNKWRQEKVFGSLFAEFGVTNSHELRPVLESMPIQELLTRVKFLHEQDIAVDPVFDNDFFTGRIYSVSSSHNSFTRADNAWKIYTKGADNARDEQLRVCGDDGLAHTEFGLWLDQTRIFEQSWSDAPRRERFHF